MRFNIIINQLKAIEWDLNLQQAAVMAYCYELSSWAEPMGLDGNIWYYTTKNKITTELPILSTKIDTIYRILKTLSEKGLIHYQKFSNKDFVRLSEKGKQWNSEKNPNSENNPLELGKTSEKSSEKFPTYNNTNTDNCTNDKKGADAPQTKEEIIRKKKTKFCIQVIEFVKTNPGKYPKALYMEFARYWFEPSASNKLRFESQQFFDLTRRLNTWFKNTKQETLQQYWEQEPKTDTLNKTLKTLL